MYKPGKDSSRDAWATLLKLTPIEKIEILPKAKAPKKTVQELLLKSSAIIRFEGGILEIQISGDLAKIPSLKNGKLPGTNFINYETLKRLQALTILLEPKTRGIYFEGLIHMHVILADSCKRMDVDNVKASIQDLLEPITIRKNRTFGLGIIPNDRFVRGSCYHCGDFGEAVEFTLIRIQSLDKYLGRESASRSAA